MRYKRKIPLKYTVQFNILVDNENLPSPIKVIVGAPTIKMSHVYINTIILKICRRYNYTGDLHIHVKFIKGSNIKVKKSIYISEDDLRGGKNVIVWDYSRIKCN